MKVKITDLMDLYEDKNCPLKPTAEQKPRTVRDRPRGGNTEEVYEVKQSKYPFGWRQALSLAAVLVLLVLGGFGVKRLIDRGAAPVVPGAGSSELAPIESRNADWEAMEGEEKEAISRFLTVFANQHIKNVPMEDLNNPGSLIHFAFVWRRNNDCESITVREGPEGLTDTLTLEQINEVLEPLLGKTVELPENDPGIVNRTPGMDFDYSEQLGRKAGSVCYRDGCFWDQPAQNDTGFFFALATLRAPDREPGRELVLFNVYYVNYERWGTVDMAAMPALSTAEAEALAAEEKLILKATGEAQLELTEDGYRLLSYVTEPEALPSREDSAEDLEPACDPDPAQLNALLTAFAEQGIRDSEQDLAGEYELAQFAHIWTKLHDYDAISYQTEDGESYETLRLEQLNETLTRLLGKTVSPAEGTDYSAQRGDNYAQHESFHDGRFWWPAADGDMHTAFAVGKIPDNELSTGSERVVLSVAFKVFEPTDYDADRAALLELSYEEADAKAAAGELQLLGDGQAWVEFTDEQLQMVRYELISNAEADPAPESEQLLAELKELFEAPGSWYNRALTSCYTDPADVNLFEFFYDGIPGESELTQQELDVLGEPHTDCDRLSPEKMDELLLRYFGLSLEQTGTQSLEQLRYLPQTGCWYHEHGDTNAMFIQLLDARQQPDGTVLFTYRPEEYRFYFSLDAVSVMTAALRPLEDGGYQLLSNLPGEWFTAESAGALAILFKGTGAMQTGTQDADGTRTVRELTLRANGSVYYQEGDPDSEFSHWESGGWWLPDDHTLALEHFAVEENGNRAGEIRISYYACRIENNSLILTQRSETGFASDEAGTELRFPFYTK